MAYDFGGTLNNHMASRLVTFSQRQFADVPGRISHLSAEISRIGSINFVYDAGGNPVSYTFGPNNSYIGKLLMVYEILGGDPLFDLQIRSQAQPVFLVAGSKTAPAQQLSSGDIVGQQGLNDSLSCSLVQQMKYWSEDVVQYKRENIERKVRRATDYVDQLKAELKTLLSVSSTTATGSVADITNQLAQLLADPTYRAANNNVTNDYQGKLTHAPLAAYNPGPNRTNDPNWVRADGGPILPGQQTSPYSNATPPTPTLPGQEPEIPV